MSSATLNAKDYGAVGDGITDDTAALQAWINDCLVQKIPGYLDSGTYLITSSLSVTGTITIRGAGRNMSTLAPVVGITAISVVTPNLQPVDFSKFSVTYPSAASTGTAGIKVSGTTGNMNYNSMFRDLHITNAYIGIQFDAALLFVIDYCTVSNAVQHSIQVANSVNPDFGDSIIANSTLGGLPSAATIAHIHFQSSGGLRVINNKVIGAHYGILLDLGLGVTTSILLVTNNSFEVLATSALLMKRVTGATGTFHNIVFDGNELSDCGNVPICSPADPNGQWLSRVIVTNNLIGGATTGAPTLVSIASTMGLIVSDNIFDGDAPSNNGIYTATTTDRAILGPNLKIGAFGANSINSTNTTVISPT